MSYKASILLVIIFISTLAASSSNLENSSLHLQGEPLSQRIRRDIYEDQYDDEYDDEYDDQYDDEVESINDQTIRRSLSSLQLADDISDEVQKPSKKKYVINRRILISPHGKNTNKAPPVVAQLPAPIKPAAPIESRTPEAPSTIVITKFVNPLGIVFPRGNNYHPKGVIITLITAHQLRENLLYIFGCLLQKTVDFLTEPQYTSLYTLYIEIRNRPSSIHLLLKELKNIPTSDLNEQMKNIMLHLGQVLPPYIGCAATFWVREIEQNRINLNSMPLNTCPSNFNILQEINTQFVKLQVIMKPIDAPTRVTEYVLGKPFVKILYDIQKMKFVISQAIFGIVLANFPLIPYNPVLDENIRYILQVTLKAEIPGWQEIELQPVVGDPYRFIKIIIAKILIAQNVPRPIKEALTYIRINLKPVPIYHANPDYSNIQKLDNNSLLELLLSFIVPNVYSAETICLKDRFMEYVRNFSFHQKWMLSKTDRLRYTNPHDLLLAYLTKLQRHIPNPDSEKARTVTALLSVLTIDKQNKQFAPASKNIDILSILGYLSNPEFSQSVNKIYNNILQIVLNKPDLQGAISRLVPREKGKCIFIDECLKEILQNVEKMNLEIPRRMEKLITELYDVIPLKPKNPKCKAIGSSNQIGRDLLMKIVDDKDNEEKDKEDLTEDKDYNNVTDNGDDLFGKEDGKGNEHNNGNGIGNGNNNNNGNGISNANVISNVTVNGNGYSTHFAQKPGGSTVIINQSWITNILLPPMMSPTQDISIYINNKGAPAVDCPNVKLYPGSPKLTMPSVIAILKPPEVKDPFGSMNQDFQANILRPIFQIIGSASLTPIFGASLPDLLNSGKFSTTGALIITLLEKAKSHPLIQANHQLLITINNYLSGLDLIAVITLPTVLRVTNKLPENEIIYSVINIAEPHTSSISVTAPVQIAKGMLVFPILDPNKLMAPVDPKNPYEGLLPNVAVGTPAGEYIQHLRVIFTTSKISQLIPNFKPEAYPNKGFLLMVILQKLPKAPEIIGNPHLKKIIIGYIWSIVIPAFYTKLSYSEVISVLGNQPQMKPDTVVLINLLPKPKNEKEKKMFQTMKILLEREDLFEIMLLPKATPNTSQKELLKTIILGIINSPGTFDEVTVNACKYYSNKMFDIRKGALLVVWELETRQLITLSGSLGQIIENVINYDKFSNKNKKVYNDLLKYFHQNQNIFRMSQDFPIASYKTEGAFLKGLFTFLLEKPIISQEAKSNIKILLPHVMLKGPGAKPLKLNGQGASSGRRSLSKFEINV